MDVSSISDSGGGVTYPKPQFVTAEKLAYGIFMLLTLDSTSHLEHLVLLYEILIQFQFRSNELVG